MARGGVLNLGGAVLSQVALFLVMLLLARVLGVRELGRYAQVYAVLSLLGLLSLSGFRAGLTRFVAVHLADDEPAALRGAIRLGTRHLGRVVHSDRPRSGGRRTVARRRRCTTRSSPPGCGWSALCPARRDRSARPRSRRPGVGARNGPTRSSARSTSRPPGCVLTALALVLGAGLTGAFWALVAASWRPPGSPSWRSPGWCAGCPPARPAYRPGELFRFSTVSWVSSLSSTGLIWVDALLLGFFDYGPDRSASTTWRPGWSRSRCSCWRR